MGLSYREVVPCRAPTGVFCSYLHFGKGRLGLRVLRTQWERHNTRTLDSSSRNSLWEEDQGATLPAPKSAHSWEQEITAQGQDSGLDTVALVQVSSP